MIGINNFPVPLALTEERGVKPRILSDAHYVLLITAVEVYHAALLTYCQALIYTSSRWLDSDTLCRFHLGFAREWLKR